MNTEFIKKCVENIVGHDQCSDQYEIACFALARAISSGHRDVLRQLVNNGPVWDGDICSKSHRDDLMDWGLASRACVKGEQGFTVANYRGWDVCKRIAS